MTTFAQRFSRNVIRSDIGDAFDREWESLRWPGSHHSSADKIAIAGRARAVRTGAPAGALPQPTAEVVDKLATSPASVRRSWVAQVAASDLTMRGYIETLAIVSRIAAIDGFHRMVELPLPPLPAPGTGHPTGETNPMATPSKAFVPMTRGTSIWWSLSLVPEAFARMEDLHCVLYLSPEQMQDSMSPRVLTRPQMELIASRTSAVNECFY